MCVVTVPSLLFYCKGLSLRFLQFLRLWSKPEFAAETKSPGSAIGSSQRAVVFFSLSSPVESEYSIVDNLTGGSFLLSVAVEDVVISNTLHLLYPSVALLVILDEI